MKLCNLSFSSRKFSQQCWFLMQLLDIRKCSHLLKLEDQFCLFSLWYLSQEWRQDQFHVEIYNTSSGFYMKLMQCWTRTVLSVAFLWLIVIWETQRHETGTAVQKSFKWRNFLKVFAHNRKLSKLLLLNPLTALCIYICAIWKSLQLAM